MNLTRCLPLLRVLFVKPLVIVKHAQTSKLIQIPLLRNQHRRGTQDQGPSLRVLRARAICFIRPSTVGFFIINSNIFINISVTQENVVYLMAGFQDGGSDYDHLPDLLQEPPVGEHSSRRRGSN